MKGLFGGHPSPEGDLNFMKMIHRSLVDGVDLIAVATNKFKTSMLSVTFAVPLRAESATANALVGEVLNRGSRNYPDIESLSLATDELYGMSLQPRVRQKGETQCVGFVSSFLEDRFALDGRPILEPAAQLMGEVLLNPLTENGVFIEDYVASEGANQADLIRSQINDKRGWSIHRVTELMCENEAYALDKYGSAEEAEHMTAQQLWDAYRKLLKEARVIFYYAGASSLERVEQVIRSTFAPLITPRKTELTCEVVDGPRGEVRSYTDRFDVAQGKLALGFRTGGITVDHPDYPAMMVCNAIYGGTASSKLFMNVREKLSLCYFASSLMDKLKGLMVVSSGVEFSNFEIARQEILTQLKAVQDGDFTDEELHVGRQSLVSSLRTMQDSHGRIEDFWVTQKIAGTGGTPEDLLQAVEKVDRAQVVAVARKLSLDTVYYLTGKEA